MDFLTEEKFNQLCDSKLDYGITLPLLEKYEINTPNRVAMFFAQCGHESGGFRAKVENLNYSAEALNKVFKKYFPTLESTSGYARNPEKIANKCYANRMGNGPESSGEGFKFRGRGFIQLTGKDNYTAFANSIDKSLDECVEYCESDAGAVESALFFWSKNGLNKFCDVDDVVGATKRINGGTNGLEDRTNKYNKYKQILIA